MYKMLDGSEVWRGGVSIDKITSGHAGVTLESGGPSISRRNEKGISFSTSIASKGGGSTRVILYIPASAFREIALALVEASPRAAISSFAAALNKVARKLPPES